MVSAIATIKQRSQERNRPFKHLFYLKPSIYLFGSGPGTWLARTQTHSWSCLLGSKKSSLPELKAVSLDFRALLEEC